MRIPQSHTIEIAGRRLTLPVVRLAGDDIAITLFDCLGDIALCDFLSGALIAGMRARGLAAGDVILTAGKAVTLANSLARALDIEQFAVAEKRAKRFWPDAYGVPARSITGGVPEQLVLGGRRAALLKDRRILIVDDVISTGESIRALIRLARHYGEAALVMAPFAEGAHDGPGHIEGVPVVTLGRLPVWTL